MHNWPNWVLVIAGVVAVAAEVALGVVTGLDLALLGASLIVGGVIGLLFGSVKVGLFSAGAMALLYFVFFRRRIRQRIQVPEKPSNTDAVLGRPGVVTERIAPHAAGMVRVGDEIWRARLADEAGEPRDPGTHVTVESVDGVTLRVR